MDYRIETGTLVKEGIPDLNPGTTILKKGSVNAQDAKPLNCDIIFEQDVAVPLRDGVKIYINIFKPVTEEKVPVVMSWGPYGKQVHRLPFPWYVTNDRVSGLQSFEGPDPGFWCDHGYAVVHADARGCCNSEGVMRNWGIQEGADAYDCIEWLGEQEWCNGSIGMSGTSYLSIMQWNAAALCPPHLKAIAPGEGHYDSYRHTIAKGGIVNTVMDVGIYKTLIRGKGEYESVHKMGQKYPLYNEYWDTKRARIENIKIPVFEMASYTNINHSLGSFDAWCDVGTEKKWLKIHNTHEWNEYYLLEEEQLKFFDRYLKGIENDWEETPKVRMAVLNPGRWDTVDRPEKDFPIPDTQYRTLYLNAKDNCICEEEVTEESAFSYNSETTDGAAVFSYQISEKTEVSGFINLKVWVEAEDTDDFEMYVYLRKADEQGNPMYPVVYGAELSGFDGQKFLGVSGWLRASLRAVSERCEHGVRVRRSFDKADLPGKGNPVLMEVTLYPMAMNYYPGEQLQIVVSGYPMNPTDSVCALDPEGYRFTSCNKGNHVIHTGGKYQSVLTIPVIPKR